MKKYSGSCHCQKVRFEILTDLEKVVNCNCSICQKKGALHHRVAPEQFKLISGKDALTLYQFNTKTAKHFFCKYCGMHPFSRSRVNPKMYSINVRCLDDVDLESLLLNIVNFDGQNWEEAFENLKM